MVDRLTTLRQHAGGAAISAVFEGLSGLGRLHPRARPGRWGIEVHRDLPYASRRACRLDVWRIKDLPPGAPTLLFVHGGGFRILSKKTHWPMALRFARAGYVVFTIDYRLAPLHPFPAAVEDACAAYEYVLDRGESFGANPSRLALSGESAGANLVLALTFAACTERPEPYARAVFRRGVVPKAVLPLCGLLQVTEPERFLGRGLPTLFEDRIGVVCRGYLGPHGDRPGPATELADPLLLLERGGPFSRPLPPMYLAVGTKDPILDDTLRAAAALDRLGLPHVLDVYEGEHHAFHAFSWREAARRCWTTQLGHLERWMSEA